MVLKRILDICEKYPDRLALWSEGSEFTYSELQDYAQRAAGKLRRDGVKKGDFVSIELGRVPEYLGFAVAAWMCGAAFVASDIYYPQARRDYIAENCHAAVRVDSEYISDIGNERLSCDDFAVLSPEDSAFLIYTSGSTGSPKGVLHNHLGLDDSLERHIILSEATPDDTWASPAAFSFITGIISVLTCIVCGVTHYSIPDPVRVDPRRIADFLAEHDISICFLPPVMLPFFRQKKKTLRMMFTGSQRLSNFYTDDYRLRNCWGPTETCNIILVFDVDRSYENTPIGKNVYKSEAYILDENGNEAEEGEICIAANIAVGYFNLDDGRASQISENPFRDRDGYERLCRTGDIGKRMDDGNILLVGRKDWMVKIDGKRVEPGEIMAVIESAPQVFECCVRDYQESGGRTRLCAYCETVAPVKEEELRRLVSERLPDYMMPAMFVFMQKLPRGINGKVDRSRLPDPAEMAAPARHGSIPLSKTEVWISDTLADITGRNDFEYSANLADCGIGSLTFVELASRIHDSFGTVINVAELMAGCSVESIEKMIGDAGLPEAAGCRNKPAQSVSAENTDEKVIFYRKQLESACESDVEIRTVRSLRDRRAFTEFPNILYSGNPNYVPAMYMSEAGCFKKNHLYCETCDHEFFLAVRGGKTVGRIQTIINHAHNMKTGESRVRFTRFDCIDDISVAKALFDAAEKWAKERGMDIACGPLGYSDLEREGLLVEGFDQKSTFSEQYNAEYYRYLIEALGYEKETDWVEYQLKLKKDYSDKKTSALTDEMLESSGLHFAPFGSIGDFAKRYGKNFFEIIDRTYSQLYGTVPFTEKQTGILARQFAGISSAEFAMMLMDKNNNPVACGFAYPAIGDAISKTGGHLTLPALIKMQKAKKHPHVIELGIIGVIPEYRSSGAGAIMLLKLMKGMHDLGIDYAETNLNLETNSNIISQWSGFDAVQHKRRRSFVKNI